MVKSNIYSVSKSLSKRKAGRPSNNQLQGAELKEHLIAATRLVYEQHGFHGTSVAKIIETAGISRPLFYRLFKSCYEVVDIVVAEANEALINAVIDAMNHDVDILSKLDLGIDAYFEWCQNYGAVVGPIYQEINNQDSPAFIHRKTLISKAISSFKQAAEKNGIPIFPDIFLEGLISAIETIGSKTFWPQRQPEPVIEENKRIIKRIVLASISSEMSHQGTV